MLPFSHAGLHPRVVHTGPRYEGCGQILRHNGSVFPPLAFGLPHELWEVTMRQLGEQLHDLARTANALAAENPGWIAPSQVAVAGRLAEAASVLRSQADQVVPRT
jgi:hypothetical protein